MDVDERMGRKVSKFGPPLLVGEFNLCDASGWPSAYSHTHMNGQSVMLTPVHL